MTLAAPDNNNKDNAKRIENEAEDIAATIKDTERFVSVFLLSVLEAVLNEQVKAKQLKREVGDYIYAAVKDQALRKGWIE